MGNQINQDPQWLALTIADLLSPTKRTHISDELDS
jgi:hypothetical protein